MHRSSVRRSFEFAVPRLMFGIPFFFFKNIQTLGKVRPSREPHHACELWPPCGISCGLSSSFFFSQLSHQWCFVMCVCVYSRPANSIAVKMRLKNIARHQIVVVVLSPSWNQIEPQARKDNEYAVFNVEDDLSSATTRSQILRRFA